MGGTNGGNLDTTRQGSSRTEKKIGKICSKIQRAKRHQWLLVLDYSTVVVFLQLGTQKYFWFPSPFMQNFGIRSLWYNFEKFSEFGFNSKCKTVEWREGVLG